jgi:serine phosphatase RsbU (regulator of sigma subunit)
MPAAPTSNAPATPAARLRVEFLGSGRAPLDFQPPAAGNTILLGRPAADVHPDVPLDAPSVSRRHAEFAVVDGSWAVRNLGKAGTMVDQVPVAEGQWRPLAHGDIVSIDPFVLRVNLGAPRPSTGPETLGFSDDRDRVRTAAVPTVDLERLAELRLSSLTAAAARIAAAEGEDELFRAVVAILEASRDFERVAVIESVANGSDWRPVAVAPAEATVRGRPFSRTLVAACVEARTMVQLEDDIRFQASQSMAGVSAAFCAPMSAPGAPLRHVVYADCRGARPSPASVPFLNLVAQFAASAASAAERRKLVGDLEQARLIQGRLMPDEHGRIGHVAWTRYSRAADTRVSGDFFSVVEAGDGRVAAALGDVAGKGAGAALVMASAVTHLDTSIRLGLPVEDAMSAVSDFFARRPSFEVATAGFITGIAVEIHPDGRCRGVDAGHSYAAIVRADGRAERLAFPSNDTMIGLFEGIRYAADGFTLAPGDRIVLFSDGVVEQPGIDGVRLCPNYSEEPGPLLAALEGSRAPDDDVERLRSLLATHAGTRPWEDDVTIASIAFVG